ncbi:MAG: hypothetical protein R3257_04340 [bacterium]|nr:hypothetical protein [bacterium]
MKRFSRLFFCLVLIYVSCFLPRPSHGALVTGVASNFFQPAISNDTDMITVYRSPNVAKHGWNAGFYLDTAHNPLQVRNPSVGVQVTPVDHTVVGNFYGTYGVTSWMSVGLNIPIFFYNSVNPIFTYGNPANFMDPSFTVYDPQTNLGDIRFETKFRVTYNTGDLFGFALVPFITMPSGPSKVFAGNGSVTGGLKVVVDFNIHERIKLALNFAYLGRDQVVLGDATVDDQLLVSLGLSLKLLERLQLIVEGQMDPVLTDFFASQVQVPAEVRGAIRGRITKNFHVHAGGGGEVSNGFNSADWRAFLGLNYHWAPEPCPACEAPSLNRN